jgi:hypothetical protein
LKIGTRLCEHHEPKSNSFLCLFEIHFSFYDFFMEQFAESEAAPDAALADARGPPLRRLNMYAKKSIGSVCFQKHNSLPEFTREERSSYLCFFFRFWRWQG